MRMRTLGSTGLTVSELCFGTMRFVPKDSDSEAARTGREALAAALDHGVTVIHSSDSYGTMPAVREVLGTHPRASAIRHVVKVAAPEYDETRFDAATFRQLVDEQLRHLGIDHIDMVQHLHRGIDKAYIYDKRGDPTRLDQLPQVAEELGAVAEALKAEGKIGAVATFPHTVGYARRAIETGIYDAMVAFYNPMEPEMYPLFGRMEALGMGLMTMRPLFQGRLADHRMRYAGPESDDPALAGLTADQCQQLQALRVAFGDEVASWDDFAIKVALAPKCVASTILSANTPDQVARAVAAADGHYPPPRTLDRLYAIYLGHRGDAEE